MRHVAASDAEIIQAHVLISAACCVVFAASCRSHGVWTLPAYSECLIATASRVAACVPSCHTS